MGFEEQVVKTVRIYGKTQVEICPICRNGVNPPDSVPVSLGWGEVSAHRMCAEVYVARRDEFCRLHNLIHGIYYWPGW